MFSETSVVQVEKSSPTEVHVGRPFTYDIKVSNLTDCELTDVGVSDRVPAKFELRRAVPEPRAVEAGEIHWLAGKLGPNESRYFTVTGVAKGKGALTHCAKVTYRTPLCMTVVAVEPRIASRRPRPPRCSCAIPSRSATS